jgi:DNA polymerase-3 subunit beta
MSVWNCSLVDNLTSLPGNFLIISTKKLITSGHSEFNLSGLDPDQYPLLPEVSRDDAIQLSVKVFHYLV